MKNAREERREGGEELKKIQTNVGNQIFLEIPSTVNAAAPRRCSYIREASRRECFCSVSERKLMRVILTFVLYI